MTIAEWALVIGLVWLFIAIPVGVLIGRFLFRAQLLAEMNEVELCAEDCGRVATHERFEDVVDGVPILLLVCHRHAGDGRVRQTKGEQR